MLPPDHFLKDIAKYLGIFRLCALVLQRKFRGQKGCRMSLELDIYTQLETYERTCGEECLKNACLAVAAAAAAAAGAVSCPDQAQLAKAVLREDNQPLRAVRARARYTYEE